LGYVDHLAVGGGNFDNAVRLSDLASGDLSHVVLDLHCVLVELVVPFANLEALLDFNSTPDLAYESGRGGVRTLSSASRFGGSVRGFLALVSLDITAESVWLGRGGRSGSRRILAFSAFAACGLEVFGAPRI
jgi:hypothetical protein